MRLRQIGLLAVLIGGGCTPDLDGHQWRCEQEHSECGSGYLCDRRERYCVPALSNEDGVHDDRIVFGMSAAISDDVSLGQLGRAALVGLKAAFHQANRSGGVHGRELQPVVMDDSYDPVRTTQNVHKMLDGEDRPVFALVGVIGTGPSLAARKLAIEKRVLFFSPASGFDGLEPDPPDRYVFNLRPRYSQEAAQLTRYLLEREKPPIPPENIAVFAQGTDDSGQMDAFGASAFGGVVKTLAGANIPEAQIATATYPATDTLNVEKGTTKLLSWMGHPERRESPDGKIHVGIVLVALHDAAAAHIYGTRNVLNGAQSGHAAERLSTELVSRLAKVVPHYVALSTVGEGLAPALASLGTYTDRQEVHHYYGEGTIVALPVPHYSSNATGVLDYREHLAAYDPEATPGAVSLEGYLAGRLLIEGLRAHGRDITTESLIDTLETLSVDLGIGTLLGFGVSSHQAFTKLWGARLNTRLELEPMGLLLQ